ncbi:MAG: NADP-dependent oxidoreductase [Pseudomonadota bacterium]
MTDTTRIVLASRPAGEPQAENYRFETVPVPALEDGQVLVKVLYLSLDPYMRGRMRTEKSYAEPLEIGETIIGESVGVVLESRSERYAVGDHVCSMSGWQTHDVAHEDDPTLYPVDPTLVPPTAFLGVCGMPGRTAYFGMFRRAKAQAGETLVVSAASGAVGSVVGQIGKAEGLHVVGVAGGPDKCRFCVEELGFDACVDYKADDFEAQLAAACPDGIDIYFESVGGRVAEAAAKLLNDGARVPICGYISSYNAAGDMTQERTPFHIFGELPIPPEHGFFVVFNFAAEYAEANAYLTEAVAAGRIRYRETVVEGLDRAPEAFNWLFSGQNFGKLVVRIATD